MSPTKDVSGAIFLTEGDQIVIGGVVNAHVAVKFIYVRLFRGTGSMHTRSFTARAAWAAICGALWILSWIIAEGIPVFTDVLGLAVCVGNAMPGPQHS